jgi:hypothetical protein
LFLLGCGAGNFLVVIGEVEMIITQKDKIIDWLTEEHNKLQEMFVHQYRSEAVLKSNLLREIDDHKNRVIECPFDFPANVEEPYKLTNLSFDSKDFVVMTQWAGKTGYKLYSEPYVDSDDGYFEVVYSHKTYPKIVFGIDLQDEILSKIIMDYVCFLLSVGASSSGVGRTVP